MDQAPPRRLIYGDYMIPRRGPRIYTEVTDNSELAPIVMEYLVDVQRGDQAPMRLVLFLDAIEHVSRIARIIRQPWATPCCSASAAAGGSR